MILSVVVLTGFALWSEAELQTHTNTFIAIPNDMYVFCMAEWDLGKWHCFTIGMEEDSSDLHVSVGETLVFSIREAANCLKSNFSYNFGHAFFRVRLKKKKPKTSSAETFWNTNPGMGCRVLCSILKHSAHTLAFCWDDTEGRSQRKGEGEGKWKASELDV